MLQLLLHMRSRSLAIKSAILKRLLNPFSCRCHGAASIVGKLPSRYRVSWNLLHNAALLLSADPRLIQGSEARNNARHHRTYFLLTRPPIFLLVVAICQFCVFVCAAGAVNALVPVKPWLACSLLGRTFLCSQLVFPGSPHLPKPKSWNFVRTSHQVRHQSATARPLREIYLRLTYFKELDRTIETRGVKISGCGNLRRVLSLRELI